MSIHWSAKPFAQLTPQELHDLFKLRIDVFVVEQQCIYPEADGQDPGALHIMGHGAMGDLVACARVLPPGNDALPRIGRVAVRANERGQGAAHALMAFALEQVHRLYGSRRSKLSAQAHLRALYERHGYLPVGEPYPLDGIPHIDMERRAD